MLLGGIAAASAVIAVAVGIAGGLFASLWGLLWILLIFLGTAAVLALLAFVFLLILCRMVDISVPQERDSKFYRTVMTLYIKAVVTALRLHIHVEGLEKVPKEGRFVLACNHLSIADPAIILACLPHSQLAFVSKKENADMFVVGKLMHRIMCQLIDRENDREALKTILKCIKLIQEDQVSIGIFPEGYVSEDGKLRHFRSGVFKIAQRTKVPVVVCTLKNTKQIFENMPKWKRTDVRLCVVDVIQPEDYAGMSTVQLGHMVHTRMAEDLGPDLVADEHSEV